MEFDLLKGDKGDLFFFFFLSSTVLLSNRRLISLVGKLAVHIDFQSPNNFFSLISLEEPTSPSKLLIAFCNLILSDGRLIKIFPDGVLLVSVNDKARSLLRLCNISSGSPEYEDLEVVESSSSVASDGISSTIVEEYSFEDEMVIFLGVFILGFYEY